MSFNIIEILGIIASIVILLSMSFDTNTFKGNIYMRLLNMIGSLLYVIYGIKLKTFSVLLLNSVLVIINIYYLYKAYKMAKGGVSSFKQRQKEQIKHVKDYIKNKNN